MPKTYTAAGTVSAGDVYTATAHNIIATDVNNMIVPPACRLTNSANVTGYTSNTDITWAVEAYDTDGMHSTVTNTGRITVQTAGIYLFTGCVYATFSGTPTSAEIYVAVNADLTGQVAFNTVDFGSQPGVTVLSGSGILSLAAGEWVSMRLATSGTSPVIQSQRSYLSATWIGLTA
jgi:hypothetical protein